MKCKVIRQRMKERQKIIKGVVSALTELNPQFEFFVAGAEGIYAKYKETIKFDDIDFWSKTSMSIYSSCKTAEDLLQLELPENIIKSDDSEKFASYGFVKVEIGEYNATINAKGTYPESAFK